MNADSSTTIPDMLRSAYELNLHGKYDEAETIYRRVLQYEPSNFSALALLSILTTHQGKHSDAMAFLERALAINPDHPQLLFYRGNVLLHFNQKVDALESFCHAIRSKPDYFEALYNKGNILLEINKPVDAVEQFRLALTVKPDHANTHYNLGIAYLNINQFERARECFMNALKIEPRFTDCLKNLGNAYLGMSHFEEAISCFEKSLDITADDLEALHNLVITRMKVCLWDGINRQIFRLVSGINENRAVLLPSSFLSLPCSRATQQAAAQAWARTHFPPNGDSFESSRNRQNEKIRIGYFSSDFYNHATAYLIAGLIENHDRTQFEVLGFSFGKRTNDQMRVRLSGAFDQFIDIHELSDKDAASLAKSKELDIAIDLNGFQLYNRTTIFSQRIAPVQINFLAYPGTMGADFIDYMIADNITIPYHHRGEYTEKIAYISGCYQVNDTHRVMADDSIHRADFGLPSAAIVFCCFNSNYKITPEVFECWMRIMIQVENSVLWLLKDNELAATNLCYEAEKFGVSSNRIRFATRVASPIHLARHRLADLFLDTLPYNAHTTASDALWTGLPVLTCQGETFAGRVGASLLNAIGLPELITEDLGAYEKLAVNLGNNPELLDAIKLKLWHARSMTRLFDSKHYATELESLYLKMHDRQRKGLRPDHILPRE